MALHAPTLDREIHRDDRKFIGRDSPATDLQVVRAEGSHVRDARGRTYIDFASGWCVGNLGWAQPAIRERIQQFDGPDYVSPGFLYAPWVEIAELLAELTPGRLTRCFRATTGTEAVELAMQIARACTGRERVISIEGDYHGNSIAVKEIARTIPTPLDERALGRLERALEHRKVCAFIMEPVICNLACELPTPEFMIGAQQLCARYGTLFVIDEVATGFGRTGKLFGCEHYEIQPDILCLAKALTSGHAPMGATITTPAIASQVQGDLDFYATFGWHPLACEAALATLLLWRDHGDEVLVNVRERSEQFGVRLRGIDLPDGAELRIAGLAIGMVVPDLDAGAVVERCRDAGLLITGEDNELTLFPALTLDRATADAGLDILATCLRG